MSTHIEQMSCAAFQAQLPELIGSGETMSDHPHLQTCGNCRALLADLETIAEAARQLFPVVEPPDALWDQIESAMKSEDADTEDRQKRGGMEQSAHG